MKKRYILAVILAMLFFGHASAQPRIAVLDFNAGVGVSQSDVNGLSAIFNTNFSPAGYAVVERTRVSRILEEQGIQVASMTESQRVRLGEILNVSVIVIGDVNLVMGQYNVDVRAVNVETGEIIAKDGVEMEKGASYRENMLALAERLAKKIPIVELYRKPAPVVVEKKKDPNYRPEGESIRFTGGYPDILFSVAYNNQITSSFMLGGGVGFGAGYYHYKMFHDGSLYWEYSDFSDGLGIPLYFETELRTPRYKWSLFINLKVGVHIFFDKEEDYWDGNAHYVHDYKPLFASLSFGGSYKNLHLGVGVSTTCMFFEYLPLVGFISYNLPFKAINKGLF